MNTSKITDSHNGTDQESPLSLGEKIAWALMVSMITYLIIAQ